MKQKTTHRAPWAVLSVLLLLAMLLAACQPRRRPRPPRSSPDHPPPAPTQPPPPPPRQITAPSCNQLGCWWHRATPPTRLWWQKAPPLLPPSPRMGRWAAPAAVTATTASTP